MRISISGPSLPNSKGRGGGEGEPYSAVVLLQRGIWPAIRKYKRKFHCSVEQRLRPRSIRMESLPILRTCCELFGERPSRVVDNRRPAFLTDGYPGFAGMSFDSDMAT